MATAQHFVLLLGQPSPSGDMSLKSGELQLQQFQHPKGHCFLLAYDGRDFYELQATQPRKYGSWFLAQRVCSKKEIILGNIFDLRFLLLPHLEKAQGRFSPLDQIVHCGDGEDRLPLNEVVNRWNMRVICDVNDQYGDDMILYRYNSEKVRAWLRRKVQRTAKVLREQRLARRASANPTFVNSFNSRTQKSSLATAERRDENLLKNSKAAVSSAAQHASACEEYEQEDLMQAVEIVGDYLTDASMSLLLSEFDLTAEDMKRSSAALLSSKKRKADWEQELEVPIATQLAPLRY